MSITTRSQKQAALSQQPVCYLLFFEKENAYSICEQNKCRPFNTKSESLKGIFVNVGYGLKKSTVVKNTEMHCQDNCEAFFLCLTRTEKWLLPFDLRSNLMKFLCL